MTPNEQMMQFIMMLKNQQNPKSIILNMIEQNASQNPVLANLLTLAKNNDSKGIEQVARNLMKEKGMDFDKEFNSFRKTFGL